MKISIILPTFNRAASFLGEAINSVINQSYENWELIIIDNYSTDNTIELVNSFNTKKISIYQINNDGIIAKSRNLGITKAKGEYIAFLDSDDYCDINKLQKCVEIIKKNNVSIACHAEKWLSTNNCFNKKYGPSKNFEYLNMLSLGSSSVSTSAIVVKKELLVKAGMFREEKNIITAEDYDMWLNVSKIDNHIEFINEPLGVFRIHDTSQSSDIIFNTRSIINVLNFHLKKNNLQDTSIKQIAISRAWTNAAKTLQVNGKYIDALKTYKIAIQKKFSIKLIFYMISLLIPHRIFKLIYYSLK